MKNADKILIRCSMLGSIMTNGRDQKTMGETAKKACQKIYALERYGRRSEIRSKYLDKGNEMEEDAITMVSVKMKKIYKKNTTRVRNAFLSGEFDLGDHEDHAKIKHITDTKCSWSLETFLEAKYAKELDSNYEYQGHGYMDLIPSAETHTVAYCLINGTDLAIEDEKRRLSWQMKILDPEAGRVNNPEFLRKLRQIEKNHIFDIKAFEKLYPHFQLDHSLEEWERDGFDIPADFRIHTVTFSKDAAVMAKIKERIWESRKYMNETFFGIK